MRFFAALWSLRQYPTARRELTWAQKFEKIRAAGFTGVMSPPIPALQERGDLGYLAITSLVRPDQIEPVFAPALAHGAEGLVVQLARWDTSVAATVELAQAALAAGARHRLRVEFETHRNTFLESPERLAELTAAWTRAGGKPLPVCFDHSHFALVRHLKPPFWPAFAGDRVVLGRSRFMHLRPFNGHHCQLPVTLAAGRGRTQEYRTWLEYVREVFAVFARHPRADRIIVPELGHESPVYRLSTFPDTWTDTCATHADLRREWRAALRAR